MLTGVGLSGRSTPWRRDRICPSGGLSPSPWPCQLHEPSTHVLSFLLSRQACLPWTPMTQKVRQTVLFYQPSEPLPPPPNSP